MGKKGKEVIEYKLYTQVHLQMHPQNIPKTTTIISLVFQAKFIMPMSTVHISNSSINFQ